MKSKIKMLLVLGLLIFASCKKDNPQPNPTPTPTPIPPPYSTDQTVLIPKTINNSGGVDSISIDGNWFFSNDILSNHVTTELIVLWHYPAVSPTGWYKTSYNKDGVVTFTGKKYTQPLDQNDFMPRSPSTAGFDSYFKYIESTTVGVNDSLIIDNIN